MFSKYEGIADITLLSRNIKTKNIVKALVRFHICRPP